MKNKKYFFILFLLLIFIGIFALFYNLNKPNKKEYLDIVTITQNDDGSKTMNLYSYDILEGKVWFLPKIPIMLTYPVAIKDYKNNKIYYSNSDSEFGPDNLFEYNLKTNKSKQLTFGKFLFNDLLIINNELYANVARQGATVTQPAKFNKKTNEFTYLNENDDDTWCFSLSYNYNLNKLVSLTTSDIEMRTDKVRKETRIRPKTIYSMDLDFKNYEPIYFIDKYEVRLVRQIDENRILMTFDKFMGSEEPRQLKMVYLDTGKEEIIDIDGILEIYSFYPKNNGEGVFILGKKEDFNNELLYYDFSTKEVELLFKDKGILDSNTSIIDFVYTIQ